MNTITLTVSQIYSICQLVKSASKDQTRFHLTFVRVNAKEGFAEATDGAILSRLSINENLELMDLLNEREFFLPSEFCKNVLKLKPKLWAICGVILNFDAQTIEYVNHSEGISMHYEMGKVSWPHTNSIIPTKLIREGFEIVLNPEYLITALESLKEHSRQTMLHLSFTTKEVLDEKAKVVTGYQINDKAPIRISLVKDGGGQSFSIMMPGRINA